ncbi:xylose repressor [Salinibacillus aidingensis]|uniref:Xylose repressor n=1 Tax=Salinibacillus aidingensis TaxID=237684 RepID=A0ABN1BG04_9BACI
MTGKKTWNQHVVKKQNKGLVLESIKQNSPISRADIASSTGLNKGTVSSLVNELLEEKMIDESGPGESKGGRRPVMLFFNQVAGYSVGIDLGVNYILGILTDLRGNIISERTSNFINLTYEEILKELFQVIDTLIKSAPESPYGIVGIGIGVPGIVNRDEKILLAPNLGWRNAELKSTLEKKFNVPVTIENEANAGAYGEKNFGIGKNNQNIVYVSVGIGIGVGLILNGQLYRGHNGFSGEFGHMTVEVNGSKCRCGNKGCWELYASEQSLLGNTEQSGNLNLQTDKDHTLETILDLAQNGDKEAIQRFQNIGQYLGVGINNIINIFNPEQVIIGNRMASAEKWLKEPLNDWIHNQTLWFSQKDLRIDFSHLLTHSTALGVAAFSTEEFLYNNIHKEVTVS